MTKAAKPTPQKAAPASRGAMLQSFHKPRVANDTPSLIIVTTASALEVDAAAITPNAGANSGTVASVTTNVN